VSKAEKDRELVVAAVTSDIARRIERLIVGGEGAIRDRGDALLRAYLLTMVNRIDANGDAVTNAESTAAMWQQYVNERFNDVSEREMKSVDQGNRLMGYDFCTMMVQMKVSRVAVAGGKLDDWVDIAGYASMAAECYLNRR